MKKRSIKYAFISLILVMAILLSPVAPAIRGHQVTLLWEKAMNLPTAQAQEPEESTIYLPLVMQPGEADPPAPPAFEIMSPANGGTISGMMYFAVQPIDAATLERVTFNAGSTTLGTDSDGSDGFNVFLNASDLPAGPLELSAIGTGVSGETTKRITVNVVPNPPRGATVGSEGGVLASEIGSIITLPPGAVPDGTDISVTEMTQQEITTENGFDWDAMGVTFLGAQKIESTATFSQPLGVASAGFGNRVQPGQAVVNYRIAPDADGDGVDELIVVNTASVAPNGDVISDPVSQISLGEAVTTSSFGRSSVRNLNGRISGPPGTLIEIETSGFNPFSLNGNVAIFRSLVDDSELIVAGRVTVNSSNPEKQTFRTSLPYFPEGATTLTLRNEGTGSTSDPIQITIEALPALTRPASEVFDDFFTQYLAALQQIKVDVENDTELGLSEAIGDYVDSSINEITQAQAEMKEAYQLIASQGAPEVEQYLDDAAKMMEVSGILTASHARFAVNNPDGCTPPVLDTEGIVNDFFASIIPFGNLIIATGSIRERINPVQVAQNVATLMKRDSLSSALGAVSSASTFGSTQSRLFRHIAEGFQYAKDVIQGKCNDNYPSPGPSPRPSRPNPTTGMGAAPPPGGNGWGHVMGGGGGSLRNPSGGFPRGRFVIKLFSGGSPIPFSGITDAGGYFFIPLINEAEPFTALAIDTMTGEQRRFEGVGPAFGKSVFMFFDFFNEAPPDITVTNTNDAGPGSLRQAVLDAQIGNRIGFDITGTITLESKIVIDKSLSILGPGADQLAISGNNITRIFEVLKDNIVMISGVSIVNGMADYGGGIVNSGDLTVVDSVISQNTATVHGGGVYNFGNFHTRSVFTLKNSLVSMNEAPNGSGGGIHNCCTGFDSGYTTLTIEQSQIYSNSVGYSGAGIYVGNNTTFRVSESTISKNTNTVSDGWGGGLYIAELGSSTIRDSTISENRSLGRGGGLHTAGDLTLINSTVTQNLSAEQGGGISLRQTTVELINSTISENTADRGGGVDISGTLKPKGTIIANNEATDSARTDIDYFGGYVRSEGYNLVGVGAGGGGGSTEWLESDQVGPDTNPMLNPLADNGGPTHTMALQEGSPAIDAIPTDNCTDIQGNPLTTDQRGVVRSQGEACDIGAYEYP